MAHNTTPPTGVVIAITHEDKPYLFRLSPHLSGIASRVFVGSIDTLAELIIPLKKAGVKHVITTRLDILTRLLPQDSVKKPNIDNYAGSIITYDDIEFLIIHPLKQLVTKSFGEFLSRRYISKIVRPQNWRQISNFNWTLIQNPQDYDRAVRWLENPTIIGVDIETVKWQQAINCIGYCGIHLDTRESMTFVLPIDSTVAVHWMRELNNIRVPKVLQNGKYDINYLLRYNAPLWGYYYDTVNMLHSWYSELPKDLASVSALFIRESMYWKDLSNTTDKMEYYKYNALDCWATAESALSWILESPDWARQNYLTKFPQVAPSIMCELRGLKRDSESLESANKLAEDKQEILLASLRNSIGKQGFNPSSPPQVKKLLHVLGYKKAEDSSEKTLVEAATTHPLTEYFVDKILEYRGLRKLSSTYLKVGIDSSDYKGRVLYALNPHGADTGRYASKKHHFWCGLQIQNIPRDEEEVDVKKTIIADEGFELWEADYSQNEDRGVAYSSGDANLLSIFASGKDSHSVKSSMFFGIPYEDIYDDATGKTLDKPVRNLGKHVNHGANYNMGARILLETMGSKKVREAQKRIGLPANLSLLDVCKHLLFLYERAFPTVKTKYYNSIKREVKTTSKLVGATRWTRYCFSDPMTSKQALNGYIAHITQSLAAMILDRAFLKVFIELGFNPHYKLNAQIHDSILFQTRIGHEYLAERTKELMTFPVPVTDCSGITREMIVPVDLKKLGRNWRGHD